MPGPAGPARPWYVNPTVGLAFVAGGAVIGFGASLRQGLSNALIFGLMGGLFGLLVAVVVMGAAAGAVQRRLTDARLSAADAGYVTSLSPDAAQQLVMAKLAERNVTINSMMPGVTAGSIEERKQENALVAILLLFLCLALFVLYLLDSRKQVARSFVVRFTPAPSGAGTLIQMSGDREAKLVLFDAVSSLPPG